jgi:hypothetical protein
MFYKEVHPPASHKACAPPFATHKASSQGGIKSTDPYHLKLRWPIEESSNRIDSPIPRFTGSKKLPPTLILERTGGESKQGGNKLDICGEIADTTTQSVALCVFVAKIFLKADVII